MSHVELSKEEGFCPYCHNSKIDYGEIIIEDRQMGYPATCEICENTFVEWYNLEFAGNWGEPIDG